MQQISPAKLVGSNVVPIQQDGLNKFLAHFCPDDQQQTGVTLTDIAGSSWTSHVTGFGPDWNPATQP